MPSTYTTNGGIELPANGEQASTWGTTVNDNMQIIDRLTNGVGAITLSGTAHTLTTSNGILSDGQYSVLVLGGSPSGTNTITVAPNDAQHLYIVKNASGQTATFTQGSGANVSVLNGTTKIIYCDGGGTGAVVVDLTGSIDLGALIVDGITVTATGTELNILDGVTSTTAELNLLDGVTATTAELNILDGVTADAAELNILDGVTSTTAELNILDGLTASTAELNLLDGVTATTAELNILDGVTSTTAELNILDGVTATTAELNYTDGVTSAIQTQLDAKAADTTQAEATWEAGTGTTESIVSPAKVKAAIDAAVPPPRQVFTSSGTWTKPSGISYVQVQVVGGGASGRLALGSSDGTGGGGGGGGAIVIFPASDIASSVAITVGAGGVQPTADNSGFSGGDSSFGSYIVGGGGQVAPNSGVTGAAGGVGGTLTRDGKIGLDAVGGNGGGSLNGTPYTGYAGSHSDCGGGGGGGSGYQWAGTPAAGGSSGVGGFGGSGATTTVDATPGLFPGGGGGSAGDNTTQVAGAGADGVVIVTVW